jgi:hypothetical protein
VASLTDSVSVHLSRKANSPVSTPGAGTGSAAHLFSCSAHLRGVAEPHAYLSSQTSSMRQPLKTLLTMIVSPLT